MAVPKPIMTVQSNPAATGGQQIALSSLVSIADPGHVGYQKLELWDSNGTVAGGEFVVNGVAQTAGHEIDVAPANVVNTVFDAGYRRRQRYAVGPVDAERRVAQRLGAV